jgi:ATP-dependent DNA helicase RecG
MTTSSKDPESVELRASAGLEEVVQTVAALATTGGGQLWIETDGLLSADRLADELRRRTEPPQFPGVSALRVNGVDVLRVTVDRSPIRPVYGDHIPYARRESANIALSREEADRLADESRGYSWDQASHLRLTIADLQPLRIADFAERADLPEPSRPEVALESLGLLPRGQVANAAALLFAKNVAAWVPGALVKCARFAGSDSVDFVDQETLSGTVLEQIDAALAFVRKHTVRRVEISGEAERRDVADYPERAVREAVINAVCHRDYSLAGNVQVRIYDDRLEIWNPGELPAQLRVEDLFNEHPSLPRNALLASCLYRVRYIEQWGSGTLRMVRAAEQNGSPKPEFESAMGVFKARFWRETPLAPAVATLPPRAQALFQWLSSRPPASIGEIVEFLGVSKSQANVDLKPLLDAGVVVKTGQSVGTRYGIA